MQQSGERVAIGVVTSDSRLEERLLHIARHITPYGKRGASKKQLKMLFTIFHVSPHSCGES